MGEEKEKPKEKDKDPKKEEKDKKEEGPPKEKPKPNEAKDSKDPKDAKEPKDEKKEKKKDEEKGSRRKLQRGMIVKTVKNAHRIEKILGSGGFGDVYKVSVVDKPGEFFAMKTELDDAHKKKEFNRLKVETIVLEDVNHVKKNSCYFVKLIDKGTTPKFKFIVMELVSHSLRFIQTEICKGSIPDMSSLYLMRETLNAIATLHELGYVHRDIKPHNFAVGLAPNERRIYILDFGISRKFLDANGKFVVPRAKVQFLGTLKYCSRACHLEKEQSMKDDFECWAYMCIEFKSDLAWNKKKNRDEILKLKTEMFAMAKDGKGPCSVFPCFFTDILKEIDKMLFTDDVGKTRLRTLVDDQLKHEMKDLKADEKTPLAWEGKAIPDSRPRKKTAVNRVQNDEDSSERKKREEKAKRREENLIRARKIEEELAKVMQEIEDGDGPEEQKEAARRLYRQDQRRRSDKKRRRSGTRRRRGPATRETEDDYDDEDDYSDEEEDSYEDHRMRRRTSKNQKKERYRDEESRPKKKEGRRRPSEYEEQKPRRRSLKGKRNGKPRSSRRLRRRETEKEEKLMKLEESPPRDDERRKKSSEKGPSEHEMEAERKDSGKRSKEGGGTTAEGSKEKVEEEKKQGEPSPNATPHERSAGNKK